MTYGQLEDRFHGAPKIGALAETLGVRHAEAAGLWANLFTWALVHAIDGDVTRFSDAALERAAMWQGASGVFIVAIQNPAHRFLDEKDGRKLLHDWWDFAAGIKKAKYEKKRRARKIRKESRGTGVVHARTTRGTGVAPIRAEQSRSEQNGSELKGAEQSTAAVLLLFPADGKPPEWALTADVVAEIEAAYPTVDVLAEARRALVWVKAKPDNRKTAKGYRKFLTNWVSRAKDSGKFAKRGADNSAAFPEKRTFLDDMLDDLHRTKVQLPNGAWVDRVPAGGGDWIDAEVSDGDA